MRYTPDIDGLRAVAVLSVMVYHLAPFVVPGGFTGVDVFFVISGYVVSASVADRSGSLGAFTLQFYAKRVRRIVPALIISLLVTALATALFVPHAWLSDGNERTGLRAFFGLSNVQLMRNAGNYFAPRAEFNPFTHTWSLGVEEQFYLLFPPLFYLWMRRPRVGAALLITLIITSLVACAFATWNAPVVAFYALPTRFWELGVGVLLFQLHRRGRLMPSGTLRSTVLVLALASVTAAFAFAGDHGFPIPWALFTVAGTAGVIAAVRHHETPLGAAPLVWIGRISYSLYLWHWPVYVLFRWTVGLHSWSTVLSAVALTFALATVSFYGFENVVRYAPVLNRLPAALVIAGGLACVVLSWAVTKTMFATNLSLSITSDATVWQSYFRVPTLTQTVSGVRLTTLSSTKTRTETGARPTTPPSTDRTLYVAGDSHATAYETAFEALHERDGWAIAIYHQEGCGFLVFQPVSAACARFEEIVARDMAGRLHPGDVVFLPSLRLQRFVNQWDARPEHDSPAIETADAIRKARAVLTAFSVPVVFEAPKPVFRAPPYRCSDWFNAMNPICAPGFTISRDELKRRRAPVMRVLEALAEHPGVSLWDPLPVLCPGDRCAAFHGRRPLYFDGDHLTAEGNRELYPSLRDHLALIESSPARRGF